MIARVVNELAQRADKYHPYQMEDVKTALFFALTGIEIVEDLNPTVPIEEQYYVCRETGSKECFDLYLYAISYWINGEMNPDGKTKKVAGMLDWMDDNTLTLFPYAKVKLRRHWWSRRREFHGPEALMQDFSWQRYRFAQSYMELYINCANALLRMEKHRNKISPKELLKQMKTTDLARAMFLATIFCCETRTVDTDTHVMTRDYVYRSNQHSDNAQYFRNFPNDKWQVVLFWWSGMMNYLHKTYPHCFKMQPTGNKKSNPLEL